MRKKWDVFIAHASEDKGAFVRPLANVLQEWGVDVWYDEFAIELGESISGSIDKGLSGSAFGIVVISRNFIKKAWTNYELRGMIALEISRNNKIIPLWHGVTQQDVLDWSPPLAERKALDTLNLSAAEAALLLVKQIRPDIYKAHLPASTKTLFGDTGTVQKLQEEVVRMRRLLSEGPQDRFWESHRCPQCNYIHTGRPPYEHYGDTA